MYQSLYLKLLINFLEVIAILLTFIKHIIKHIDKDLKNPQKP